MIYFLHGDTAPLQIKYEEILNKIKNENPNIPEKIFDASLNEIDSFFDSASTNSIFSPKELLILKRAETFKNLDAIAKSLKLYNLAQKEIVIVYEETLNDYGKILNKIPNGTLKNFQEIAEIICYRKENEMKSTIFFIQQELQISEHEAEQLIELIGNDYFKIKNEVEKIKNFLNGEAFSLDKIKSIITISKEFIFKDLIDKFLTTKEYKELLYYLQKEKLSLYFIKVIFGELTTYLNLLSRVNSGLLDKNCYYNNFKDKIYPNIQNSFKTEVGIPHSYSIFLKLKYLDNFTEDFLIKKLNELTYLDYEAKSGQIDLDMGTELFILNFFKK